ncbi:protein BCAP-like isoform X2 [Prorops nasuta]
MLTPDVSNIELTKRVNLLELENERLRIELENSRIELNARIAANEGLKGKISELYVEIQAVIQSKQKLQNTLTDTTKQLSIMEASTKWYQGQLHNTQANKKALQLEVSTYQQISKQRQQTINSITGRCRQLVADYTKLMQKYQEEKHCFYEKLKDLEAKSVENFAQNNYDSSGSNSEILDLCTKLEISERELYDTRTELKVSEQRLMSTETAKNSMENLIDKQQSLIKSMEDDMQKWNTERSEMVDKLCKMDFEKQQLKAENEILKADLHTSTIEQNQVEDAMIQLRTQLTKMIAQYKLIKARNTEVEEKLNLVGDVENENKKLKKLSYQANSSLLRKLMQEKRKIKTLQKKLQNEQSKGQLTEAKSMTENTLRACLKQALSRNKDLKDQLKSLSKSLEENIDEGYGDNSILSSVSDIPTPMPNNSVLLNAAAQVLSRSKDFSLPLEKELSLLEMKMISIRDQFIQISHQGETRLL